MDMIRNLSDKDIIVSFNENQELKDKVYESVLKWYIKHGRFNGESICQCDETIIDAPQLLAYIADDIFEFDVKCDY